uniref:Uncharacterized protein n=1 Tax=Tabanus bromius TaxID=304241 RepID=A0A0K8TL38_TABBR
MGYDSDYYTTRRTYSRPIVTSYTYTTPRYRVETIEEPRRRANEYSYSYSSSSQQKTSSGDPYSRPERQASSTTVERSTRYGPGGDYSYSSSRATTGSGPGGYSYSSTSSGRLPYGTSYRHYSYRV